jgi:outer membrane autotransporter protein
VNGLAGYAENNYSSERNIVFPGFSSTAAGATNGDQYTANLDGGYDWHVNERLTLSPLAGLQYVHLDVNGFNESGAGAANLALGTQSINSLKSRLGGRVAYHLLTRGNVAVGADLRAAWQHEYLDDSRAIRADFMGDGLAPFSVRTSAPLRDAAVMGMGLDFTFHERLTLFLDYEIQLWSRSYVEQAVNGGFRIGF